MHIFSRKELLELFDGDEEARVARFERLLKQAVETERDLDWSSVRSVDRLKASLQYYKDEPTITLVTFAALQKIGATAWAQLLGRTFPGGTWDKPVKIMLEKGISPSKPILTSLCKESFMHPVKYARMAAQGKKVLEGATDFDAILTFADDIHMFVEAKFTSDISIDTTHCTTRNQLARCIDVGLASVNDEIERFYLIMLTPELYQQDPGSRLYYFKMKQYKEDPQALAIDIPRLENYFDDLEYLSRISDRLSFVSWEQCAELIVNDSHWTLGEREWLTTFYEDRRLYYDIDNLIESTLGL